MRLEFSAPRITINIHVHIHVQDVPLTNAVHTMFFTPPINEKKMKEKKEIVIELFCFAFPQIVLK